LSRTGLAGLKLGKKFYLSSLKIVNFNKKVSGGFLLN